MKPGVKTSEFWLTAVMSVATAIIAILVGYGLLTSEEADLWTGLIAAIAPIAIALMVTNYTRERTKAKASS